MDANRKVEIGNPTRSDPNLTLYRYPRISKEAAMVFQSFNTQTRLFSNPSFRAKRLGLIVLLVLILPLAASANRAAAPPQADANREPVVPAVSWPAGEPTGEKNEVTQSEALRTEETSTGEKQAPGPTPPSYAVTVADYEGPEGIRPGPRIGGRPLTLYRNAKIDSLIRFYLEKRRDVVERGYRRSGRYLPMIRRILAREGVPPQLAYLAAVESNYNPLARSPARAVGLWQFTAPTARSFGLRLHRPWYDERMDPEASTVAAARLLAYLYDRFDNWELALAAYNTGEGRVFKAMADAKRRTGKSDFWSLRLPRETRGFIPSFLALSAIWEDPEAHGLGGIIQEHALTTESVEGNLSGTLEDLARRIGVSAQALVQLNPAWKGRLIPPFNLGSIVLHVPQGQGANLAQALRDKPPKPIQWLVHRIEEGDTVSGMASMYGVRVREILSLNRMGRRTLLRIGRPLLVPLSGDGQTSARATRVASRAPRSSNVPVVSQLHFHTVRDGESFWSISRRYGVRMTDLRRWNVAALFKGILRPSQELVVFLPGVGG